jgi:signal transduction histidine kinase/CheY-like chemotaxis protein
VLRDSMDRAAVSLATQLVRDTSPGRGVLGVACPLLARGAMLGVLAMVRDEARPPYDPAAIALMEDLASRAAIAIDNCLLYQEIQQRDVRKDRFVAMLAHELRNPLGAITSALGVLEILGEGKDLAVQARAVIKRQLQNLTQLVDDLLDVARVTSGKITLNRSAVNLAESVERCLQAVDATGRTAGYTVSLDLRDTWIDVDPTRLDQILGNLIGNALKYTPKGGSIAVRAWPEGDDGIFEIEDSGVGMSPEVVARVFELFFQADRTPDRAQGGLGVGLALVRQLVELHGGRVEAASGGEGRGSLFTFRLPRAVPVGDQTPGRASSPAPSARSRIVVIEDNKDAREMLGVLLNLEGHEVLEAVDGPTGIEVTEATGPELVFVDVGLPGVDGYEVARRLRASRRCKDTFLIALTGYGQPEDRRKALEAGFDAHIVKPIDPNQLTAVIASARRARHEESRRTNS